MPPARGVDHRPARSRRIQVPGLPAPTGAVRLGDQRGQRGLIAGQHPAQPSDLGGAAVAKALWEPAKRCLVVDGGVRLQVIAGGIALTWQNAAVATDRAGDLLGEALARVLDRDVM